MLKDLLKRASRILHLGAHHAEELELYESLGAELVVWVEADPAQRSRLIRKLRPPRHLLVMAAVSDSFGAATLHRFNISGANSILPQGREVEGTFDGGRVEQQDTVSVNTVTVDGLHTVFGPFTTIVADIQGAELRALHGGREALRYVDTVVVEVIDRPFYDGGCTEAELTEFLGSFGLRKAAEDAEGATWRNVLYRRVPGIDIILSDSRS